MSLPFVSLAILLSLFFLNSSAQNTSPYWSVLGNSNVDINAKMGTTNSVPLRLFTNNQPRVVVASDGKVGIGTTSPQQFFHVEANGLLSLFVNSYPLGTSSGAGTIGYTKHLPTATGQRLGYFIMGSRGGGEQYYHGAGVVGYAAGPWNASSWPAYLAFETTPAGSTTRQERLRIGSNGNIGIGSTAPVARLEVNRNDGQSLLSRLTNSSTAGDGSALVEMRNSGGVLWRFGVGGAGNGSGLANGQFYIKRDGGVPVLTINQEGMIGLGTNAPASQLHVIGNGAFTGKLNVGDSLNGGNLKVGNGTFAGDIFLGGGRFLSTGPDDIDFYGRIKETHNTFVGINSGLGMTPHDGIYGRYNTAVGENAMRNHSDGSYNTALGAEAMRTSGGFNNTAVGYGASSGGSENTAIGSGSSAGGEGNVAVGYAASSGGYKNISMGYNASGGGGSYNIGIGYFANAGGSFNIALGLDAGMNGNYSNVTVIGAGALAESSNSVLIGNTAVTTIGGQVNWTTFSDGRFKRDIKEDVQGLPFIKALRPITYTVNIASLNAYKAIQRKRTDSVMRKAVDDTIRALMENSAEKASRITYSGFVAQEVEEAAKKLRFEFSGVDKPQTEGGLYGLRYSDFVVPLVKAVQELSKENDELRIKADRIEDLEERLARLESLLSRNTDHNVARNLSAAYLAQNTPNPSRGTTTIKYGVPEGNTPAKLTFSNAKGQLLKTFNLASSGTGSINLDTSALPAGVYNYTLWIAGTEVDTKRLVIVR